MSVSPERIAEARGRLQVPRGLVTGLKSSVVVGATLHVRSMETRGGGLRMSHCMVSGNPLAMSRSTPEAPLVDVAPDEDDEP